MNTVRRCPVTIIQFTKSPEGENVKTRMSSSLNTEQRLTLHKAMTQRAFQQSLFSHANKITVAVDGNNQNAFFSTLHDNALENIGGLDLGDLNIGDLKIENTTLENKPYSFVSQQGDDLGQKMFFAANNEMQSNTSQSAVILIGSDCPFISSEYLNAAIEFLDSFPVVIGPANDGGYVLLGMRKIIPALFKNISWGSERVFEQTCKVLRDESVAYKELDAFDDIDRPEDLVLLSEFSEENDYFRAFFQSVEF